MTRTLVAIGCTLLTAGAMAQGTVNFRNVNVAAGVSAPVFQADGTTRLGTGYWAQLYAGPAGTAAGSLVAVGVPVQFQNNITTGLPTGQVNGGAVDTGLAGASSATIQMRAWAGSAGANYEAAFATGAGYGFSTPITVTLGNSAANPPTTPADLVGLASFNLVVPEPSTIALGLLGAAALLIRRRK